VAVVLLFQEGSMFRRLLAAAVIVALAVETQAATVEQKKYAYSYEAAWDTRSDHEYVICSESPRSSLVTELHPPPIAIRFGSDPITDPVHSCIETAPAVIPSLIHPFWELLRWNFQRLLP